MRISRGIGAAAAVATFVFLSMPARADDACRDAQCPVLADATPTGEVSAQTAEVPLPPMRPQARVVVRQPRPAPILLASARNYGVAQPGTYTLQRNGKPLVLFLSMGF